MKETRDRHEHSLSVPHRRPDEEFRTLSSSLSVELAARSHPGRRSANEDHYLVVRLGRHLETLATSLPDGEVPARFDETGYGIFVADGMGRLGAGERASRLAISTFAHLVLHYGRWNLRVDPRVADEVIQRGLHFYRSIDELVTETARETSGRGTTLTVAYIADDTLFLAHVGHSRAYLLRQTSLTQLTRDQTLAQRLDSGAPPAPMPLAAHDLGHLLTDAIGGRAGSPSIQIGRIRLEPDDCLLLCTNGLTDVVDDESIRAILLQPDDVDQRCQALVDLALSRGSADNVTAVLAKYCVHGGPVRGSVTHL
jgi:serine/threonine protein phosphatase PrpC